MRICPDRDMRRLSNEHIRLAATRARALGDPTRVRILSVLERGERAVGHIAAAVDTQQSTASKHLQVLYQAGLVQRRRNASVVLYSLSSSELPRIYRYLAVRRLEPCRAPTLRRRAGAVWKVNDR